MTDLDHSTRYDLMASGQVPADKLAAWMKEPGFAAYVEKRQGKGSPKPAPSDDLLAFAITETFGPRCESTDADCLTCKAWAQYARLTAERGAEAKHVAELHADNERLRWRHQCVIPEWNDLTNEQRRALVRAGEGYADEWVGGDLAVHFYAEIRKILANGAHHAG